MLVCFLMASLRYHLVRKLIGVYKLMMLYTHQENKTTSKKETDQHLWRWFHSAQRRQGRSLWLPTQPNQQTNPFVVVESSKTTDKPPLLGCWRITNYRRTTSFGVVGPLQTAHKSNFSLLYARHRFLLNSTTCTLCYP